MIRLATSQTGARFRPASVRPVKKAARPGPAIRKPLVSNFATTVSRMLGIIMVARMTPTTASGMLIQKIQRQFQ